MSSSRIEQLGALLQGEPNDVFLNYALGMEYIAIEPGHAQAEEQFKKVLALDENYIAVYYQLGKLMEAKAQNGQALQYYRSGLEIAKAQKNNKAINEFGEAVFMLED